MFLRKIIVEPFFFRQSVLLHWKIFAQIMIFWTIICCSFFVDISFYYNCKQKFRKFYTILLCLAMVSLNSLTNVYNQSDIREKRNNTQREIHIIYLFRRLLEGIQLGSDEAIHKMRTFFRDRSGLTKKWFDKKESCKLLLTVHYSIFHQTF